MFLPHFDVFCDLLLNRRTGTWNLFVLYNNKLLQIKLFLFQNPSSTKAGLCPLWRTRKKPFDVTCYLYKMKQSHWLLCVAKNCEWSRKITPLSNFLGMKTYSECRIELRNLQILEWYYDENRIFPFEAILKHKQVACMGRKVVFTIFVLEIFKFLKYAN